MRKSMALATQGTGMPVDGQVAAPAPATDESPAATMIRGWVRVYTSGLPAGLRAERRAELDSDLYDHAQDAARSGEPFAASAVLRCLFGIPADLAWRVEHARTIALIQVVLVAIFTRIDTIARWTVRRGIPGLSTLLAGAYVLIGTIAILALPFPSDKPVNDRTSDALFVLVSGAMIYLGMRIVAGRPKLGLCLVLAGSIPLALVLSATIVVPVVTGVTVATALVKARFRPGRRWLKTV